MPFSVQFDGLLYVIRLNRQNLTSEVHFYAKITEANILTRQSLQTIYQRKTQVRQKLNFQEADDIAKKQAYNKIVPSMGHYKTFFLL